MRTENPSKPVFHQNRDYSYFSFTIDLPHAEYNPTMEHILYAEQMD